MICSSVLDISNYKQISTKNILREHIEERWKAIWDTMLTDAQKTTDIYFKAIRTTS